MSGLEFVQLRTGADHEQQQSGRGVVFLHKTNL